MRGNGTLKGDQLRTFISAATAFYMFEPGEKYSEDKLDSDISREYVIWPEGDVWRVKYRFGPGWQDITDKRFDSENAAFCFAYNHFENI